jgi:hypothetical protein
MSKIIKVEIDESICPLIFNYLHEMMFKLTDESVNMDSKSKQIIIRQSEDISKLLGSMAIQMPELSNYKT